MHLTALTGLLCTDDVPVPETSSVVGLSILSLPNHYAFYRTAAYNSSNRSQRLHNYLRTTTADITVALNKPHALGAFSRGERVYFVFREEAVERRACGVKNVSGLARFCKNDIGHKQLEKGTQWTSFTKVRLQCNDKTEPMFPFDDIHGSAYVPDMDDGVLFGTFVFKAHGSTDSAICAFRWQGVEEAFNSSFVKLPNNDEYELGHPFPADEVNFTRPGGDCPPDPNVRAVKPVHFLHGHPLLIGPAKPRHGRPFYARRGLEFESLAAFVLTESWGSWVVCYVATAEGAVLKIAEQYQPNGSAPAPAVMVDTFNITGEPIRKMLVSLKRKSLYVFSDDAVLQYRLDACEGRHFECAPCVLDPFCGWDGNRCLPHTTGGAATTTRTC
ncbi:semaphorin-2A-like isoform X2 [Haemaphysalis longicornis]